MSEKDLYIRNADVVDPTHPDFRALEDVRLLGYLECNVLPAIDPSVVATQGFSAAARLALDAKLPLPTAEQIYGTRPGDGTASRG